MVQHRRVADLPIVPHLKRRPRQDDETLGQACRMHARGDIMRYQISGKQIDIGEALQTHVKAELGEVVEKYAQRPTECTVVFSRVAHEFVCETTIHLSTGLTAQAKGHAAEVYAAFESCREKMD